MRRSGWLWVFWAVLSIALAHDHGKPLKPIPIPPKGTAEAVRAAESDLPGGAKAEGRAGDFVLRNHEATFVIAGARRTSGYSLYGGRLLDAVRNAGGHDADMLGEMFLAVMDARGLTNARLLKAVSVRVESEGGEGKPAIVRAEMVDERFPIVDQALRTPSQPIGVHATLTYTLNPDSPTLQIECQLQNATSSPQRYTLMLGWVQGDGMVMFLPPFGSASHAFRFAGPPALGLLQTLRGAIPFVANVGSRLAYGVYLTEGVFTQVQKVQDIYLVPLVMNAPVEPQHTLTVRWAFTVSEGELETIRREWRRHQNTQAELVTLRGRVIDNTGKPLPDARVYLMNGSDEFVTLATTDELGRFTAQLTPGAYQGMAFADHHSPRAFRVEAPASETPIITLEAPALLQIRALNERRRPEPVAVVFERLESASVPKPERVRFGEEGNFGRFERTYFSLTGDETLPVEPGKYRITLTRGFEYEVAQQELTLVSGETTLLEAILKHTAPMPGYLAGDFHVHALPSPDSHDPLADKVKAYIACGVHILTATDHDINTDFSPVIRQLKAENRIVSIVGTEITPVWPLGHFNAYPQRYDPNLPNNGAVSWYDLGAKEIFEAARKNYDGDVIVQVNHPRAPTMGYFAYVGFDPKTGEIKRAEEFSDAFDAIEVFNGDNPSGAELVMQDWYYFLNQGKRYLAIGNTDSHHAYRLQPGYPRTYIYFGHRDPRRVTPANLTATMRQGNLVVCGGPMLTFYAQENRTRVPIGGTVRVKSDTLTLVAEVRAPSWIRTNKLQVVVNGQVVKEVVLNQPENAPLNYRGTIQVPLPPDAPRGWVILIARGEKFTALYGAYPLSFTNPLYWERE
ncbi:MAG: CehA/McbA family metallohydrolase [Armatimonadetes bacterium]|nr:CehA/McbA family metallohydrolase [Armatimonadota bacterium]